MADDNPYGLSREELLRGQIAMIAMKHQRAFNAEVAPLRAELLRLLTMKPLRIIIDSKSADFIWPEDCNGQKPN